jgi:hypothetical protein
MVSFDSTQIALYLSLVFAVAAIGLALTAGVVVEALVHHR